MSTLTGPAASSIPPCSPDQPVRTLLIERERVVRAPSGIVWEALLEQIGPAGDMPDGTPFPMRLEPWPGGRWYRDLGEGAGHLWAHVQVIKPPRLLELCGPLFMSYPALSHVQYRLVEEGDTTRLRIAHRAMGLIAQDHAEGVVEGWDHELDRVRERSERRRA